MTTRIHEEGGHYLISSHQCWMPGVYESREAAQFAFEFCDDLLVRMRDNAIQTNDGIITMAAMKQMERDVGFLCGEGAHRK